MSDIIINMHGSFSGNNAYIRISYQNNTHKLITRGIPKESKLYFISGGKAFLYDEAGQMPTSIEGAAVVSENKILMYGAVRFARVNIDDALRKLRTSLNSERPKPKAAITEPTFNDSELPPPKSEAFSQILSKAKELYNTDAKKPVTQNQVQSGNNPFSDMYPNSKWRKICKRNGCYFEGSITMEGEHFIAQAVPAKYVNVANMEKFGFSKTLKAKDGSLYVMRINRVGDRDTTRNKHS